MLFYTCRTVFNVHWHSRAQKMESCTLTVCCLFFEVLFGSVLNEDAMAVVLYAVQVLRTLFDRLARKCLCVKFSRSWRCWTIKNLLLDSLLHLQTRFCYGTSPAWWRERSGDERWKLDRGREVRESEIYE